MKRLLLNSLFFVIILALVSCSKIRNKTVNKTNIENTEVVKRDTTLGKSSNTKVVKGDTTSSKSSNTESSDKGSHYKEMEIKHNAQNQAEIDSIKQEKTQQKIKFNLRNE